MVRLTALVAAGLTVASVLASSVVDLAPDTFDSVVLKSKKPALVEFFAPWCGHCKNLAPVYEELAGAFAYASDKVTVAKVDADNHKSLGKRFGVSGFPTLKWFDGVSDSPEEYNGGRDLDSLAGWITDKTGVKPKLKKVAPSAVEMLTDKSFKAEVGGDKDVLVAFTAPWCGHCKSLAPTWESVAADFAAEPNVLVAKVDAEAENAKATAREQGVSSYPTIKFFPRGSTTPEMYEGGRAEQDLVAFLNAKAGTHRAPGGGLDASAGTVEALDLLIGKLATGATVDSITTDVKKAATGLKDKYAHYYLKVLGKLEASKDYADKELRRLEGIIKKGGLAPEKADDVISRSNILRKFVAGEDKENVNPLKDEL